RRCGICRIEKIRKSKLKDKNPNWNFNRKEVEEKKYVHVLACSILKRCLKLTNQTKTSKTEDMLGYSRNQLLEHLETFEVFKNNDKKDIHIDHILPVKSFVENGITDLKNY